LEIKVACSDCGTALPSEWAHQSTEHSCAQCGSTNRLVCLAVSDSIDLEIHDSVRGKVRNTRLPAKKNPRIDFFRGDDLRNSDGKWMRKDRVIDKDRDLYTERVIDPKTGATVHHCEEPLSKHFGHGSAKFTKKD
jgi:hypothetical protein